MEQNEKGLMQWEKDFLISITILIIATIIAHIFFYQTAHNINVPMIYTLATFFISRYTKGYGWGIVSSLLSVIFINWRFTFPYFKINFMIDGYPMTSLNREKEAAVKREKELAKLNEYNKQINELQIEKEKEKMRSNLLRAISHDLRTPLTGMIGASSTYLEAKDQLDEEAKDQLVMGIKEDANWLLNMVENLLSITRIQSNGSDTQPHVKKVPEPLEEVVAEATLIEQVIMNLLENAWVHSGSDAPIELDIKEEANKVVFYIRDHGNGIAPERLDQLFDGCAGALDHESRKGMGIGLSICKSIVMAHQGDVYARNYEDGAEFRFSLPMDEKELTEEKEL